MQEVNVSELRNHLPEYLSRAESGEEILVTRCGRVIARILFRQSPKKRLEVLRARARIGDVVSPIEEAWEAEA